MMRAALGFALTVSSLAFAAEVVVKGMTVPEFDVSGRMVRRLNAESAIGGFTENPKLKNAFVEFFAPGEGPVERIATLDFQDGIYDRMQRIVTGVGHVVLRSPKGDVSGDGFEYDLVRNRLLLKSAVGIDVDGFHIVGNDAEVILSQPSSNRDPLILKAVVKNGVVVTATGAPKIDFDRATTDSAIYTASDETIVLASPVDVWKDGKRAITGAQEIKVHLGKEGMPATNSGMARPKPVENSR